MVLQAKSMAESTQIATCNLPPSNSVDVNRSRSWNVQVDKGELPSATIVESTSGWPCYIVRYRDVHIDSRTTRVNLKAYSGYFLSFLANTHTKGFVSFFPGKMSVRAGLGTRCPRGSAGGHVVPVDAGNSIGLQTMFKSISGTTCKMWLCM